MDTAFGRYHMENPVGDSFLMTMTFPPHLSLFETWVKAAVARTELMSLLKRIIAIEIHRGNGSKTSKVGHSVCKVT